jgi:hypothetical protein
MNSGPHGLKGYRLLSISLYSKAVEKFRPKVFVFYRFYFIGSHYYDYHETLDFYLRNIFLVSFL